MNKTLTKEAVTPRGHLGTENEKAMSDGKGIEAYYTTEHANN